MEHKPAVAFVFHHIGPYHHARLNAAIDKLSVSCFEWSAKGYDQWSAPDSAARYQKISDEPRTWWKEMIKRRIVDLYSAAIVGGQRHVEYLIELGMPRC
jgi:hypothetical protein